MNKVSTFFYLKGYACTQHCETSISGRVLPFTCTANWHCKHLPSSCRCKTEMLYGTLAQMNLSKSSAIRFYHLFG